MSHFVSVKTTLNDMSALRRAASNLGFIVVRDSYVRGFNDNFMKADYVLKLPGDYDVGFTKNKNGTYEIKADFWYDHISKYLGHQNPQTDEEKIGKLLQEYSREIVLEQARSLGYMPIMEKNNDGIIEMRFSNGE